MLPPDTEAWSYVGNTCQSLNRRAGGKTGVNYIMGDPKFGFAIETYGWDNFQREVIEEDLTAEEAKERERYWIDYYDSIRHGFNSIPGGGGKGRIIPEFVRHKISEKVRQSVYKRAVVQTDKEGNIVAEYESLSEAMRATGWKHIKHCLYGQDHRKTTHGYSFAFKSD